MTPIACKARIVDGTFKVIIEDVEHDNHGYPDFDTFSDFDRKAWYARRDPLPIGDAMILASDNNGGIIIGFVEQDGHAFCLECHPPK